MSTEPSKLTVGKLDPNTNTFKPPEQAEQENAQDTQRKLAELTAANKRLTDEKAAIETEKNNAYAMLDHVRGWERQYLADEINSLAVSLERDSKGYMKAAELQAYSVDTLKVLRHAFDSDTKRVYYDYFMARAERDMKEKSGLTVGAFDNETKTWKQ